MFLASVLLNQQTWIIGIIQIWQALELLFAYWHLQPLEIYSKLVRKAMPALSAGVHYPSLLSNGSGRHHPAPAPTGPDVGNHRARQAAGQLPTWQPALPPCQLRVGLSARRSSAAGDPAAEPMGFGATWGKPHGAWQVTRHSSKRSWTPKINMAPQPGCAELLAYLFFSCSLSSQCYMRLANSTKCLSPHLAWMSK